MGRTILNAGLMLIASVVLAGPLAGCRGERTDKPPRRFFPDMDKQRRWNAQETTEFFADGRTGRPTPEHAVAFSTFGFDPAAHGDEPWARPYMQHRETLLAADDAVYRGVEMRDDGTQAMVDDIPVRVTRDMVEHGRDMYNIYCVACHGYAGDGKGMVGQRWSYPPANLTGAVYRDRTMRQGKDGHLFTVIREGLWSPDGSNRMPGYGHALDEMDAWAVVSYIRALQVARGSDWADLPPEDQAELGRPTPAEQTPAEQTQTETGSDQSGSGGSGSGDNTMNGGDS